jgi:puromycin-sensitive aminopeptidase
LNEAFATFMEMLAVDAWKPEWQRWTTFGASRAAAFAVDALWSTRSIEMPVSAPRDADAMFDVLTYEKGASVLRMLEQYLGPEVFRTGIREYIERHAFANTETVDLWAALGRAAKQPIPAMMDGWIFQPGFPLVTARLTGRELVLAQQPFTYLSSPPPEASSVPGERRWHVPVRVRVTAGGRDESHSVLLDGPEARVPVPDGADAVLVNAGGHGFYRVRYTGGLLERLLARLPSLDAIERFNLVSDAWATTVAGLMTVREYVDLTARFREERDRNVWSVILGSLHALNRIVASGDRPRLEALVRDRVRRAVEWLGWDARAGEDELTRQLRGDLVRAVGTLGNDAAAQTRAAELYSAHMAGRMSVDANVLPALIAMLAHAGDAARYDEFLGRFRAASTPQEEQRYLYALAGFRQPELLEQTLQRTINGEVRTQDAPFLVRTLLMSVYGRELAWSFVKTNWDTMDRLYPKHGLRRMAEGVTGLASDELERDVREFFRARKIDLGGKTLEQYLEQLHVAVTLRAREGTRLAEVLGSFA